MNHSHSLLGYTRNMSCALNSIYIFLFGTGTSIKSGWVKLILWTKTFPLSDMMCSPYERGVQPVHWSGARRVNKGSVNLGRALQPQPQTFYLDFLLFIFLIIIRLSRKIIIYSELCLSLLCIVYVIWTFCCTGNKAFMKVYKWFYWTSNPQF